MATTYKVYRDDVLIASPSLKTYTDTGLTDDVTYGYQVSAVVNGVEGPKTNKVFATPTAVPPPPPPPPPPGGYVDVNVPGAIDATGATDVSTALMAFLNGVAPNSRVLFPPNSTYRCDIALKISGRNNVWFEGQGSTKLQANGIGFNEDYSLFYFQASGGGNNNIIVHGFNLIGSSTTPGIFVSGKEGQHGVLVDGGSNFEIYGNTGSACWGDFVEVNSGASNIKIHDNSPINCGRNSVSIIHGHDVDIYNNNFPHSGYMPFDVEPNTAAQPCYNIKYRNNVSGFWSNAFFAVDGTGTGAVLHDIEITGNTSNGKSLLSIITGPGRKTNITFTGNTSNVSVGGPVLEFHHVDGLKVYSNTQPLSSGTLLLLDDCPGAVTSPPTPPVATGVYGPAINIDSKANLQIGWTDHAKVSHRFRATQTSTITSVKFQQRGGPIYSGGNGGTCRVSIQADNGGNPSGTIIGSSGTLSPGNPGVWTTFLPVTVSASVTAGTLYHVVLENTAGDPVNNYFSINDVYVFNAVTPRQPKFSDTDYAVLYAAPSTWSVQNKYTSDMDITYANGAHDGMGYIQNMIELYGTISGSSMVREHFTASATKNCNAVYVRVRRGSGSDPLIIRVKQGTTVIATVSVPASAIPNATSPGGDNGGSVWVGGSLLCTLTNGQTYDVELSSASSSSWSAAPIRKATSNSTSGSAWSTSLFFNDGVGQKTSNGGSSWSDMYAFDNPNPDIQFYFKTT